MTKIILTVPHAQCPLLLNAHHCDTIAPTVAKELRNYLSSQNYKVFLYFGNVPRTVKDLNRVEARNSNFYQKVFGILEPGDILIDVHSFPPNEKRFGDNDFVFYEFKNPPNGAFVDELFRNVKSNRFYYSIMEGSDINLIVPDALNKGVKAVLVEFNERNIGHESQLAETVGESIVRTINRKSIVK